MKACRVVVGKTWERGERDGGSESEDEGERRDGEGTEEKTRLHVTGSPEPIWSQSVFHYRKLHRLYTELYIPRTLVKLIKIVRPFGTAFRDLLTDAERVAIVSL